MNNNSTKWEIYHIYNTIRRKSYIGITKRGVSLRWRNHISDANHNRYKCALHRAIRKYGPAAFTVETIYVAFSREDGIAAEKTLIQEYGTFRPRGYNLTLGGDGHEGPHKPFSRKTLQKMRAAKLGKKLSEEHKAKIGRAHKGKTQSQEWIEKRTAPRIGRKMPPKSEEAKRKTADKLRGKPRSEDTKQKISAANKGRKHSSEYSKNCSDRLIGKPSSRSTNAKSGLRGAYWNGTSSWFSHIMVNRKKRYLGSFRTAEEAHAMYCRAAIEAFGENARFD